MIINSIPVAPDGRARRQKRLQYRWVDAFVALGVLAAIALGARFLLGYGARIEIAARPADATVFVRNTTSGETTEARGALVLDEARPGSYLVRVTRSGYATRTATLTLRRGQKRSLTLSLEPLLFTLVVLPNPETARIVVRHLDGGKSYEVRGAQPARLPAGRLRLSLSSLNKNPLTSELFLDRDTTVSLWLDPKGQLVHALGVWKCGPAPKGVAISPDGSEAWVTLLGGSPSVEVYDLKSGVRTAGIALGRHGAVEVVFSSDGTRAYVSQMETASVYEIDVRKKVVIRRFDTESAWTKFLALSPDGTKLYASNWSGNDVSEIDLASGTATRRIPTVATPRGLFVTRDGKCLYVAGFGHGEIDRIDLSTGARTTVFLAGGAIRHLVADERRGYLYASDMAKDCIWRLNMKTGEVVRWVKTDHKPNTIDISSDGRLLFVSCRGANNPKSYYLPGPEWGSVLIVDALRGTILDAIVGGNQCTALDATPDGRHLIFSDFLDNRLRYYEVPAYEVLLEGKGGRAPSRHADIRKR